MPRTTFTEHRGKRIAKLDFANIIEESDALAAIAEPSRPVDPSRMGSHPEAEAEHPDAPRYGARPGSSRKAGRVPRSTARAAEMPGGGARRVPQSRAGLPGRITRVEAGVGLGRARRGGAVVRERDDGHQRPAGFLERLDGTRAIARGQDAVDLGVGEEQAGDGLLGGSDIVGRVGFGQDFHIGVGLERGLGALAAGILHPCSARAHQKPPPPWARNLRRRAGNRSDDADRL